MTRFARAKGSKSSNERTPEDGTPWEVMKEQLLKTKQDNEYSQKRLEAEQQRIENYEKFLKDQKVLKRKATWCDFPEAANKKKLETSENKLSEKTKQQDLQSKQIKESDLSINNEKKKKKKDKSKGQNETVTQEDLTTSSPVKKSKKKNKKNKAMSQEHNDSEVVLSNVSSVLGDNGDALVKNNQKEKKRKKRNIKKIQNIKDPQNHDKISTEANSTDNKSGLSAPKKKNNKLVNGLPSRRKPINDNSFQLMINGKEVNLVRYDGFPIMEKDADRLHDLRNNMVKKGIPKSEIQRTMKLERRRAEKALARIKREVCYNCRKGGHNLSDCPDLKSVLPGADTADGICFKCGSTEHKQFECKVQKDKEGFKFASCFICKEQGHIARQCPDNPKGLYPNGGGCNLCGDVTHMKKDCPTIHDKREGKTIKLNTLDNADNLEDVDYLPQSKTTQEKFKAPKKIKF